MSLSALLHLQTDRRATRSGRPVASPHLLDRSFEDLAGDLEELEGLAVNASGRLGLTGRVLLRHRRDLHGDSLDLIEDHLRRLVFAYDGIRRDARKLRADAEHGRRSPEFLAGLAVERSGLADRLRTLQGIAAAAMTASEWQSPSFAHSGRSNAGTCTGAVRPHVDDYRRDRHPDAAAFEAEYLAAYVDPVPGLDLRALVTSCGMSAFATIVGFLQMERKLDGPVVLGASTYHECRDLLRAMVPKDALVEAPEHPADALPSAILRHRPAAVFLDSVGNAPGTLVADVLGVVRAMEAAGRPSYLVLDNTALACTVQPFRLVRHRRHVRLIVFESLTKYAQFGLDRVTGGAIVAEGRDAEDLDRYREHLGSNISDAAVHAIPRPNRLALERRLSRIERNALVMARCINEAAGRAGGGVVVGAHHPALEDHPSFEIARTLRFRGGWFSIGFSPEFDRPEVHHRLVDLALEEARLRHVPLIGGASFGLDTTRVYPTAATTRCGRPFVRVSPGIEHAAAIEEVAEVLASVVAQIAEEELGPEAARGLGSAYNRWAADSDGVGRQDSHAPLAEVCDPGLRREPFRGMNDTAFPELSL
jgi:cystathionine beta-lyase/cystathionine gamma-synthase